MTTKLGREETVVFITGHLPLGFLSRNTVAAAETQSRSWHKNERSSRSSSRPCSLLGCQDGEATLTVFLSWKPPACRTPPPSVGGGRRLSFVHSCLCTSFPGFSFAQR